MKAIKWFLVGVVVLLLAKLASFYLFPNNAGNVLVQWGGYDYRSTVIDAFLIGVGILLAWTTIWSLLTAPVHAYRQRKVVNDRLAAERAAHEKALAERAAATEADRAAKAAAVEAAVDQRPVNGN